MSRSARNTLLVAFALVAFLRPPVVQAYFEESEVGVRSVGFGRAFTAIADDASAIHWNAAGLAKMARSQVLFAYSRPYNVEGLQSNYLSLAMPLSFASAGISWHHFGAADILSEDTFSLALARDIWESGPWRVAVGATGKLARIGFADYTDQATSDDVASISESHVTADASILVRHGSRFRFGANLANIGSPSFDLVDGSSGGTDLLTVLRVGAAFQWNPESILSMDIQQVDEDRTEVNIGGEVSFFQSFAIRAGISSDLGASVGATIQARRWGLDLVTLANRPLGASYRASIRIPFGSSSEGGR